jgi:hypothetical protein
MIEGAPPLMAGNSDLLLSSGEVESLREFIDPRRLGANLLKKAKDGRFNSRTGASSQIRASSARWKKSCGAIRGPDATCVVALRRGL